MQTMSYLDSIVTPEQQIIIRRLIEIRESCSEIK